MVDQKSLDFVLIVNIMNNTSLITLQGKSEGDMKIYERIKQLPDDKKEFYTKRAGGFSGVNMRTLQTWVEYGLLKAKTEGTGDRRKFSPMQCIEIALVKTLSKKQISFKLIKKFMRSLRKYGPLEKYLKYDQSFINSSRNLHLPKTFIFKF